MKHQRRWSYRAATKLPAAAWDEVVSPKRIERLPAALDELRHAIGSWILMGPATILQLRAVTVCANGVVVFELGFPEGGLFTISSRYPQQLSLAKRTWRKTKKEVAQPARDAA